jgi:tetratricopeptide (TPR) repeat protein
MRCSRFTWRAMAILWAAFLAVSAKPTSAQGPAETLTVPSLQALGTVAELDEPYKGFRAGDLPGALRTLRMAAEKNSDLPPAQAIVAGWLAEDSQLGMARTMLEQLTVEAPGDPEAFVMLADLAGRSRQIAEATLLLAKAQELLPAAKLSAKRTGALKRRISGGLATLADTRRDWETAQKHFEALLAEDPKNPVALDQLARALFYLKKPDEALARLQEAAKLDPTMLAPEARLAQLYQQRSDKGDPKTAGEWWVKALTAHGKDARVRRAAAQWSLEVNKPEQAEEQAKAAVQLDPESAANQIVRGMVAMVRKDYKTSEESFSKGHLLAPLNFTALSDLTLALAEQKDDAKKQRLALEFAQVLTRMFPDQPETAGTVGRTLHKLGKLDEAEAQLRKAVSTGTTAPEPYYFYAEVLAARGQKENAKKFAEAALRAVKSPAPFLWRAEAEALAGKPPESVFEQPKK